MRPTARVAPNRRDSREPLDLSVQQLRECQFISSIFYNALLAQSRFRSAGDQPVKKTGKD